MLSKKQKQNKTKKTTTTFKNEWKKRQLQLLHYICSKQLLAKRNPIENPYLLPGLPETISIQFFFSLSISAHWYLITVESQSSFVSRSLRIKYGIFVFSIERIECVWHTKPLRESSSFRIAFSKKKLEKALKNDLFDLIYIFTHSL